LDSKEYFVYVLKYDASHKVSLFKMPHYIFKDIKVKTNLEEKYTTALTFQSGSIIISSINKNFMRNAFRELKTVLITARAQIEENLDGGRRENSINF
jgi:hypothetical protein